MFIQVTTLPYVMEDEPQTAFLNLNHIISVETQPWRRSSRNVDGFHTAQPSTPITVITLTSVSEGESDRVRVSETVNQILNMIRQELTR